MLVNTPDGKVGFARGVCMTGTENTKDWYVLCWWSCSRNRNQSRV